MSNLTNAQIKQVLERYSQQKEYRRVYYGNKYKNDPKYRQYVRDYNKLRYENKKKIILQHKGRNIKDLELDRAVNLYNWYKQTDRLDLFKERFPDELEILPHYMN